MLKRNLTYISKSKYLQGLQCPKLLWYVYNRKQDIPPPDAAQQYIFDEGKRVGILAQQLFPGGVALERNRYPEEHSATSLKALERRVPLFEAGFTAGQGYALADILSPADGGAWDLTEVKSTTSVKPEHLPDIAFQLATYRAAGVNIRRCALMHINNEYVRNGDIKPDELFISEDVTKDVEAQVEDTRQRLGKMLELIAQPKEPQVKIGPQCGAPYECPVKHICWAGVPEQHSVFALYRGTKTAFSLLDQGVQDIRKIPTGTKLTENQMIQVESHNAGAPHIDKSAIRDFLDTLEYPLYFLDFETVGPAVPVYDNSRPYQQVPFQYVLLVVEKEGASAREYAYLAPDTRDPRPEILRLLREQLGARGSIVAYNATFEIARLEESAQAHPEYEGWFNTIKDRFVDLLVPFRQFAYYHPAQEGSNSMKAVLPALTGTSYEGMEIAEGGAASREFLRVTWGQNVDPTDRARVRESLEKYCALDTRGMVGIVRHLGKLGSG